MPKKASSTTVTYRELGQKLDETVAKLQDPEVAIDDAVACYEEAMHIIAQLEKYLNTAENRIRKIKTAAKAAEN
jgi:exodeoxyribonuclease VII small subunit